MTNPTQEKEAEWLPNKFNYGASPDNISKIQERVQARMKNKELTDGMLEGIKKSGVFSEDMHQTALLMSMYMHTSYELGKTDGLRDIEHMVNATIDKHGESLEAKKNG